MAIDLKKKLAEKMAAARTAGAAPSGGQDARRARRDRQRQIVETVELGEVGEMHLSGALLSIDDDAPEKMAEKLALGHAVLTKFMAFVAEGDVAGAMQTLLDFTPEELDKVGPALMFMSKATDSLLTSVAGLAILHEKKPEEVAKLRDPAVLGKLREAQSALKARVKVEREKQKAEAAETDETPEG